MTTPTLSMRIFGASQRSEGLFRRRSEAAKKAWRTRRRRARPTAVMRRWLEWLDRRPENVVVQWITTGRGHSFTFGAYPEDVAPQLYSPHFTRGTFFALQSRGWVEPFLTTEERYSGSSFTADGRETRYFSRQRFWRITDKGRQAVRPDPKTRGEENMNDCAFCGGPLLLLGRLGNREHLTCRDCGMACSHASAADETLERCLTCGRRGCVGYCDEYDIALP